MHNDALDRHHLLPKPFHRVVSTHVHFHRTHCRVGSERPTQIQRRHDCKQICFFLIIVTSAAHRHCLQVTHSIIFQFCVIFLSVFAHVSHPYRRVDNTMSYALMIIYLVFIGQCRAVIVFSTLYLIQCSFKISLLQCPSDLIGPHRVYP